MGDSNGDGDGDGDPDTRERQMKLADDNPSASEIHPNDRLSLLPDSVLANVLSFLPIKSAACTSVLSRRWRRIWTKVKAIRYHSWDVRNRKFFTHAVDHILPKLTSSVIHTFEFHGPIPDVIDDFSKFISQLCGLHVKKMEVLLIGPRNSIPLPNSVFATYSLETLVLGEMLSFALPDNGISLPNLRNLSFCRSIVTAEFIEHLIRSCPNLEDFSFNGYLSGSGEYIIDIVCQNLKKLCFDICSDTKVVINAPKLQWFYASDCNLLRPCFASSTKDISEFELGSWTEDGIHGTLERWECVKSIQHIHTLVIRSMSVHDCYVTNRALPVFQDLKELRVTLLFPVCWKRLMYLLHNCPGLEVLVLRRGGLKWDDMTWSQIDSIPTCLSSNITRIEMRQVWGDPLDHRDFELVKFILKVAEVLQTFIVSGDGAGVPSFQSDFCQKFYSSPRISRICQIRFLGDEGTTRNKI